jgi:uncharacterized protein YbbC (DUF1343 family)
LKDKDLFSNILQKNRNMNTPKPAYRLALLLALLLAGCQQPQGQSQQSESPEAVAQEPFATGAERLDAYLPKLEGKTVALVVNQTSRVGNAHLADTLLALGVRMGCIFAPEHGFRGEADAGAHIANGRDAATGLPIYSLYGKQKRPSAEQLAGIDAVVFDIQDVGARFYTYISTMHEVMEACAAQGIPLLVLDRPNPNGHYVDGPVLEPGLRSFVGMHPIPIVHGLTVGELARMINGEGWLEAADTCRLEVVPCRGYSHQMPYALPVRPSPNLPNARSVALYPSLCLFEGTQVSVGRGTDWPFQVAGSPFHPADAFSFVPAPRPGAQQPMHLGKECRGLDLREGDGPTGFSLEYLRHFYQNSTDREHFFNAFFDKLAGTALLRKQLEAGDSDEAIRASWQPALDAYRAKRARYLLYP